MAKLTDSFTAAPRTRQAIGEVRTYTGTSEKTGQTHTIHVGRTDRPYVEDYVDALNRACTRDDLEWYVDSTGEPNLQFKRVGSIEHYNRIERRNETERARHNRMALETARTERLADER